MPLLLLAALLPHFAYAAGAVPNATGKSLARFVPRDSNLYVEIRDLRGLMRFRSFAALDRLLRMPHASAPTPDRRLAPWLGRIKAIVDIDRDELLRSYFGDEVAVAAPSWERLADGVVLARVRDSKRIERLFARAHGPVLAPGGGRRVCTLGPQEGLWLAARGDTIVLGPSPGPGSYFLRVAELLTGRDDQPTLKDEAQFVEVRRSLPPRVRGWLFVRRGDDPPADTPTEGPRDANVDRLIGTFLDKAAYLGAAFEVGDEELRITAAGHAARAPPFLADAFSAGLATCPIPEATLLSWRFGYDYASACRTLSASSRGGTARFLVGLAESAAAGASLADDILAKLGPDSALLVGYAEGPSVGTPFDLPLVSFIVRVQPPERVVLDTADALARKLATIANFQLLRAGRDDLIRTTQRRHNGVAYSSLPIGRFLATQSDCEFLASLDLSWCVHQQWLILSIHPAHLKQIIDAGIARRRRPVAAAPPVVTPPPNELIVVRPRATAALIDAWLKFLRASHPHMLEDGWWQLVRQRRTGARVQLGLGLKTDAAQPGKVLVALTLEGWPAYESISKGDFILGVDGRLLSTEDPLAEFKRLLRDRKYLDRVLLRVEHEGKARDVRVEIPPSPDLEPSAKNPVQLLAPLARLCEDFTLATYRVSFGKPGGFFAELVLRFDPARRPDAVTPPVTIAPHK